MERDPRASSQVDEGMHCTADGEKIHWKRFTPIAVRLTNHQHYLSPSAIYIYIYLSIILIIISFFRYTARPEGRVCVFVHGWTGQLLSFEEPAVSLLHSHDNGDIGEFSFSIVQGGGKKHTHIHRERERERERERI